MFEPRCAFTGALKPVVYVSSEKRILNIFDSDYCNDKMRCGESSLV